MSNFLNIEVFFQFINRLNEFHTPLIQSLFETGIMMIFSVLSALTLGLPLGTYVFLTSEGQNLENIYLNFFINTVINIVRSFPFLLLVIVTQPLVRTLYGRATGDPVAASFPLMIISIALYSRFVEQALLDVPKEITELANAMGATTFQYIFNFLYVEARSSLIIGFTTAFISFLSYSTILGAVGGGGIGDFAIRYGYHRYEKDIMFIAIIIIIILVQIIQWLGFRIATHLNKK